MAPIDGPLGILGGAFPCWVRLPGFTSIVGDMTFDVADLPFLEAQNILKPVILSNAQGLILLHNHPSGSLEPSDEDVEFTRALARACELMGLELFDQRRDDIVSAVIDIIVPRVGGEEGCRRLRAARPDLPIVAISGYHAGAITSELHAVVDAVVQKPFNPSALEEVLRGAITARAAGAR